MKATKKSPYTNWIGGVLVIVPAIIFVAMYFVELRKEPNEWVLAGISFVGLALWFGFSDEFFRTGFDWIKSKMK